MVLWLWGRPELAHFEPSAAATGYWLPGGEFAQKKLGVVVFSLGRYRSWDNLTVAAHARDAAAVFARVRAAGVEPVFATIAASDLEADATRRALNAAGRAAAAAAGVAVADLGAASEAAIGANAARLGLAADDARAWSAVGLRANLGGTCADPLAAGRRQAQGQ